MTTHHNKAFAKEIRMKSLFWIFFCIIILSLCPGCEGKKMADPEGMLKTRSVKYWKMRLMEKDYKAAYEMEEKKGKVPYEEYLPRVKNAGQLTYVGITVEDIKIDGDKGDVKVVVKFNLPGISKVLKDSIAGDRWVIEKNQWMHVLKIKKHVLQK